LPAITQRHWLYFVTPTGTDTSSTSPSASPSDDLQGDCHERHLERGADTTDEERRAEEPESDGAKYRRQEANKMLRHP
jgi:hypothetical protein